MQVVPPRIDLLGLPLEDAKKVAANRVFLSLSISTKKTGSLYHRNQGPHLMC